MGQGAEHQEMQMVPEAEEVVGSIQQSDTTELWWTVGRGKGTISSRLHPLLCDHFTKQQA